MISRCVPRRTPLGSLNDLIKIHALLSKYYNIYPALFAIKKSQKRFKKIQKLLLSLENGADLNDISGLSIYSHEQKRWIHNGCSVDSTLQEVNILANQEIKEIILSDDRFLGTTIEEYQHAFEIIKAIKTVLI